MLKIAISPCPNDTFIFDGWINNRFNHSLPIDVTFGDIEQLNCWAIEGSFDLIKLSFNCYFDLEKTYQLLPVGAALGFNCGPKIIARTAFPLEELRTKRLATPGKKTTAHLLSQLFAPPPKETHVCLYHEIAQAIDSGHADCGLIIHESRFTFQQAGFVEIADLGEIWHQKTALPLPLGAIAVKRNLSDELIEHTLRSSLKYARNHPKASESFVLYHAQDQDPDVVAQHIATYVNEEADQLSTQGKDAIQVLSDFCRSLRSRCPHQATTSR